MMATRNLSAILRSAAVILFGLLPSLIVAAYASFGIIAGPAMILSGDYAWGTVVIGVACLSVFGTYALGRHVLGTGLYQVRIGMVAGLLAMAILVLNPFVRVALDGMGVPGLLPTEGIALAAAIGTSLFCTFPLVVYVVLTYKSWRTGP